MAQGRRTHAGRTVSVQQFYSASILYIDYFVFPVLISVPTSWKRTRVCWSKMCWPATRAFTFAKPKIRSDRSVPVLSSLWIVSFFVKFSLHHQYSIIYICICVSRVQKKKYIFIQTAHVFFVARVVHAVNMIIILAMWSQTRAKIIQYIYKSKNAAGNSIRPIKFMYLEIWCSESARAQKPQAGVACVYYKFLYVVVATCFTSSTNIHICVVHDIPLFFVFCCALDRI